MPLGKSTDTEIQSTKEKFTVTGQFTVSSKNISNIELFKDEILIFLHNRTKELDLLLLSENTSYNFYKEETKK